MSFGLYTVCTPFTAKPAVLDPQIFASRLEIKCETASMSKYCCCSSVRLVTYLEIEIKH
jgi:hypothetical protein